MTSGASLRLDAETHRALERLAVGFGSDAHIAWLTEALVATRNAPDDPLAPLELLVAMQGSPYAARPNPRAALSAVGQWLEKHLAAAPTLDSARLAVELGWLRRLATAQKRRTGGGPVPAAPAGRFGGQLPRLRALHAQRVLPPPPPSVTPPPPSAKPEAPPPPATHYKVGVFDVLAARSTWQDVRKRLKAKKEPRDKRLPLAVRSPALPTGVGLEASFTLTEGLADIFRDFDRNGGVVRDFHVIEWDETRSPWLAKRVAFEA